MYLFSVLIAMFKKSAGDIEVLIPAFNAVHAEKKARKLVNRGKLYFGFKFTRFNEQIMSDETVQVRERITGFVTKCEPMQCGNARANHPRQWDEIANDGKGAWHYTCPRYNGRQTANMVNNNPQPDTLTAFTEGWRQACDDFNPRAKCENKLKNHLKTYEGNADEYAKGYRAIWTLKTTQHARNKPITTSKPRRKAKQLTEAAA